ncbi:MAG: precorrin-6y C5,15-methyltransferase (decarboxylating) subunit CbiE [Proteobacteria bacterium]|nr:precorrin-6y C5,15-methyltransferase (decarboxylating) subunit CbiE [Pseudomonadota bacterium]
MEGLKIYILGFPSSGYENLSSDAKKIIDKSDIVFLSKRFLNLLSENQRKNIVEFPEKLGNLPLKIKEACEKGKRDICIIATGDPNFFGITKFLKKSFPDNIEKIIPSLSIMQEAFARLQLNWDDAKFFSLHGRNKDSLLPFILKTKKGFLFTADSTDVLTLLNLLKNYRLTDFKVHLFENIGEKEESIKTLTFPYLIRKKISPLNVIVFEREKDFGDYPGIGIDDDAFEHKKGMITKREIRSNAISLLELREGNVLWDIGAGSGSVSIEASFNPPGVLAYAIEKDDESFLNLKRNIEKFSAINVIPVFSDFRDVVNSLPEPDRIFIGGTGGSLDSILPLAYERLKKGGSIVISLVSMENLNGVINFCISKKINYELSGILSVRGKKIKDNTILNAQNPVYMVRIRK